MPRKSAKALALERAEYDEAARRAWEAYYAEMVPLDEAYDATVGMAKAVRDTGRAGAEQHLEDALNLAKVRRG